MADIFNACIQCLSTEKPLLKLTRCNHLQFLHRILSKYSMKLSNVLMCFNCHAVLRKADLFHKQVEENCTLLQQHQLPRETTYELKLQKTVLEYIIVPEDFVKDSVKVEDEGPFDDDPGDVPLDYNITFDIDDLKPERVFLEYEQVKEEKKTKKSKKNLPRGNVLVKKKRRVVARTNRSQLDETRIRKIIMTEQEMSDERRREGESLTYLKMAYTCKTCIIGFDYKRTYDDHMEKRHDTSKGDLVCGTCASVFDKQTSFAIHCKRHYVRYECVECGRRMVDKEAMVKHQTHHHAVTSAPHTCELCGFVSDSKRAHRYHKEKHNAQPQCADCGRSFINKNSLQRHIVTIHQQERTFACDQCDKVYRGKSGLLMHRLTHGGADAAAFCEPCNIQFKTIYNLQNHLKTHSRHAKDENKRFVCEECGAKFLFKRRLQEHIDWTHLKKQHYVCLICNKKYSRLVGLERHVKYVHEKIRPPRDKMCDYCGRGFTTNAILAAHIRIHTGERPFHCRCCPATFAHSAALYTHTKLLHKLTHAPHEASDT